MATDDRDSARRLDPVAVAAARRRLLRFGELPWLHGEVARRLGERLQPMRIAPTRILAWWASLGGGAEVLRGIYPGATIVPVEVDRAWAEAVRTAPRARLWSVFRRRKTVPACVEADDDAAIGQAQIVWANMMLHLVADPPALFARWHGLLEVDGLAVFSCLGPGSLRELREIYAAERWPAPTPGFIDMHDLGDMLVHAGFAEPVLDQETLILRWRNAEALLAELHLLGGNTAPDRFVGLRTPAWRRRLVAALGERAAADGSIGLSVEVAYGHGFKAAPRQRPGEPVSVALDTVRATLRQARISR